MFTRLVLNQASALPISGVTSHFRRNVLQHRDVMLIGADVDCCVGALLDAVAPDVRRTVVRYQYPVRSPIRFIHSPLRLLLIVHQVVHRPGKWSLLFHDVIHSAR